MILLILFKEKIESSTKEDSWIITSRRNYSCISLLWDLINFYENFDRNFLLLYYVTLYQYQSSASLPEKPVICMYCAVDLLKVY